MRYLITGSAGFIGSNLVASLLEEGHEVIGVDRYSNYYSPSLKHERVKNLINWELFTEYQIDLSDLNSAKKIFQNHQIDVVIHLAAQAGVRLYGLEMESYVNDNLSAFANILICSDTFKIGNFLYASSSSVYGNNASVPYKENEKELTPLSFYGATKKANEILVDSVSRNSVTRFRGLRFFTVYGPWGRPDMAYFKILLSLINNEQFTLYGDGTTIRDFTYIDDVISSIKELDVELRKHEPGFNDIVNIAGGKPSSMNEMINALESVSGRKLAIKYEVFNSLDVKQTNSDFEYLDSLIGRVPTISLETGLGKFYDWASSPEIRSKINAWKFN